MINKSNLLGFINKFNFDKELVENVKIQNHNGANRVHCLTEDRTMYIDVCSKDLMFEKDFILADIKRFINYIKVFDENFEYELNDSEDDENMYPHIKLFDKKVNFKYTLGEDILLMNTQAPASLKPMEPVNVKFTLDEKQSDIILNSLKLSKSYFVGFAVRDNDILLQIGDESIKEPVIEVILDGETNDIDEEHNYGKISLKNFETILSVNKNCSIKIKFGTEVGSGLILESEDKNSNCLYALNLLTK